MTDPTLQNVDVTIERLTAFTGTDLEDLCTAAEAAILDGGGFGWVRPPRRSTLESYWQGVVLVPERQLFVGRVDGTVAGSAQLMRPARHNEAQSFAGQLTSLFVAPWARGFHVARRLMESVEERAVAGGFAILNMDIRETQTAAITLAESLGYCRWGTHPHYALVNGDVIAGQYFFKRLPRNES